MLERGTFMYGPLYPLETTRDADWWVGFRASQKTLVKKRIAASASNRSLFLYLSGNKKIIIFNCELL